MFTGLFVILDLVFIGLAAYFAYSSWREMEPRAPLWGLGAAGFHLMLLGLILWFPALHWLIGLYFLAVLGGLAFFSLELTGQARSLKGAIGYAAGKPEAVERMDERDSMFARNRSLRPDGPEFEAQYARRPEQREIMTTAGAPWAVPWAGPPP